MSDAFEPTLPILLLGVVFHEARYVEDLDELQLWRWPSDAERAVAAEPLPDGDELRRDEHGVLVGVAVHDAARRARLRVPVRLGHRYGIPPRILRDLIFTATIVEPGLPIAAHGDDGHPDAARELRGLLDAIGDLVNGSSEEVTSGELADLHDRLLAAVAAWADPLGLRPFDAPVGAGPLVDPFAFPEPDPRFAHHDHDGARTTTLAALAAWAAGEREEHPLARGPVRATDAQLLALLHHARRAGLDPDASIRVTRHGEKLQTRLAGAGLVVLDPSGRTTASVT